MMAAEVMQTFPPRHLNPRQPLSSERLIFAQCSVMPNHSAQDRWQKQCQTAYQVHGKKFLFQKTLLKMIKKSQIVSLFFFTYRQGRVNDSLLFADTSDNQEYKYESNLFSSESLACLQLLLHTLFVKSTHQPKWFCSSWSPLWGTWEKLLYGMGTKNNCTSKQLVYIHIMDTLNHVTASVPFPMMLRDPCGPTRSQNESHYGLAFLNLTPEPFSCLLFCFICFLLFSLLLKFIFLLYFMYL